MNKVSTASHQQVQKHLANNSPSKLSFRFSRSKRFKDNNPQCPIAFYAYSSQLSKRRASIGSAKKIDSLNQTTLAPKSTLYNPDNYYQFTRKRGQSFGLSRQQSPNQSYLIPQIHKNPGPSHYNNEKAPKMTSSSFSMRLKVDDTISENLSFRKSPGPGAYNAPELKDFRLKSNISKYKGATLCAAQTSPRFSPIKDSPSPQSYADIDGMSQTARYVVSQHRGRGTRPFTREKRFTHEHWRPSRNPAPVDYDKPSDFGQYGSAKDVNNLITIS